MKARVCWSALVHVTALCVACSVVASEPALTDAEAKALFNLRGCNACHEIDEVRIGPPYRAIAIRYQNASPDQVEWLATKIIQGGAGSWGFVPMVGNPRVPPEEARAIARWILALKPSPES